MVAFKMTRPTVTRNANVTSSSTALIDVPSPTKKVQLLLPIENSQVLVIPPMVPMTQNVAPQVLKQGAFQALTMFQPLLQLFKVKLQSTIRCTYNSWA